MLSFEVATTIVIGASSLYVSQAPDLSFACLLWQIQKQTAAVASCNDLWGIISFPMSSGAGNVE